MIETNLQIDCFVTQNSILICLPLYKEKLDRIFKFHQMFLNHYLGVKESVWERASLQNSTSLTVEVIIISTIFLLVIGSMSLCLVTFITVWARSLKQVFQVLLWTLSSHTGVMVTTSQAAMMYLVAVSQCWLSQVLAMWLKIFRTQLPSLQIGWIIFT